jgi:hypothetical protein
MITVNDFIPLGQMLRDVSTRTGDPEYKSGLTRGWYIQVIRDALDSLAFSGYPQRVTLDFDFPKVSFRMDWPKGVFNIQEVYGINGDDCSVTNAQNIYWKREFNPLPYGKGYTAARQESGSANDAASDIVNTDPFNGKFFSFLAMEGETLYYFNVQNGVLFFSNTCSTFDKIRIVCSGTYGDIDNLPCVPRPLKKFVMDYGRHEFYIAKANESPGLLKMAEKAYQDMYDVKVGSWWQAMKFMKSVDKKKNEDLDEYNRRGNW